VSSKLTADIKVGGVGGAENLRRVARLDPRTFCTLLGKVEKSR
jgi:hypothetical protein